MDEPERHETERISIEDLRRLVDQTPAPGKNCARSALRHIEQAKALRTVDPEMCWFRLITAEEEAAAAVFHALRRRRYPGADRLKPTNHVHKLALWPFVIAVQSTFWIRGVPPIAEITDGPNGEHIRARLPAKIPGAHDQIVDPPLDWTIHREVVDHSNERQKRLFAAWEAGVPPQPEDETPPYDFELPLSVFTKRSGSMLKYVREKVAIRRQLLYAGTEGYWAATGPFGDKALADDVDKVISHLILFLMVDPYPKQQLFVNQCLPIFLRELELLPPEDRIGGEGVEDSDQPG